MRHHSRLSAAILFSSATLLGACGGGKQTAHSDAHNNNGPAATAPATAPATATTPGYPADTMTARGEVAAPQHHSKFKGALAGAAVGALVGGKKGALAGAAAGAAYQHHRNHRR